MLCEYRHIIAPEETIHVYIHFIQSTNSSWAYFHVVNMLLGTGTQQVVCR